MSSIQNIINSINILNCDTLQDDFNSKKILDIILPKRESELYLLDEIDKLIYKIRDEVEDLQRENNNYFDQVLDANAKKKLENLYQNLHNVQLDVMKLQCDIAFTKEQYDTMVVVCDNPIIQERRSILEDEQYLKKSLHQLKFKSVVEFFEKFIDHLGTTVYNCQRLCSYQGSSYLQQFDWSQFQHAISLIKACGKTLADLARIEKLYQSSLNIVEINFKQPLEHMELNNFIEFQDTYSLELLLEVATSENRGEKQNFKELLLDNNLQSIFTSNLPHTSYVILNSAYEKLKSVNVECCKLLVDLNMNYIEANLTDGINIDKLNGCENTSTSFGTSLEEQKTLPIYAFSPQEFITQIGQHLLTLRKQAEQFDITDNRYLRFGLESLQEAQNIPLNIGSYSSVAEVIMRCISHHCIRSLLGRTNQSILTKLTPNGRRQLATDALYLDNVLEDLGLLDNNEPYVIKFKSLLTQD